MAVKEARREARHYAPLLLLTALLLAVGALGYLGFVAFTKTDLSNEEFSAYGLVVVALAAGTASFFSPCGFSVLPSYLAFAGQRTEGAEGGRLRAALKGGAVAALGVVTAVSLIGVVIAALGTGVGDDLAISGEDPSTPARAIRIVIGTFVLSMGLLHMLNLSHKVPVLGKVSAWAIRAQGEGGSSLKSVYLFGAGYVIVGIG